MTTIETSIMVNVPARTAHDQWTQFEEFPKFMCGVTEVTKLDDMRSHWKFQVIGKLKEWGQRSFSKPRTNSLCGGVALTQSIKGRGLISGFTDDHCPATLRSCDHVVQ